MTAAKRGAWRLFASALLLGASFAAGPALAGAPVVVASSAPVHGLAAAVMAGAGEPALLIPAGDSEHTHALRPSEARKLAHADLVFWIGPGLEPSLAKPISALPPERAVALLEAPGIVLRPLRRADAAPSEIPRPGPGIAADPGAWSEIDPHIWLDPRNARAMVAAIANALGAADPANRAVYARNAEQVAARLDALDAELARALAPLRGLPFIPFHDAYQYLEGRYGLATAGAVTPSPERAPGARHVRELRAVILERRIRCIFVEPQFEPALARTLAEGTSAVIATLDPLGADLPQGPDFYFLLLRRVSADLQGCLLAPRG